MNNSKTDNKKILMKKAPFRYGGVVNPPYFIDRERELEEITLSLEGGSNIIVYSPRRYGKTSLIHRVAERLEKKGMTVVYLDFFQINSREKFLTAYLRAMFAKSTRWERTLQQLSGWIRSARPVLTMDQDGKPVLSLDTTSANVPALFEEVVHLPEKLASKKQWVVIFDEFQEIEGLNGESFEKELRACIQHHQQVNYVLMGSKKHLLLAMVTRKNRAFYNFGKLFRLQKIPSECWIPFLQEGLEKAGFSPSADQLASIIREAGEIPFYIQYLALEVLECALLHNQLDENSIAVAFDRMIGNQEDYFRAIWETLSFTQQQTLMALAHENQGIYSKAFMERYKMSTLSGIQRSVSVLMKKGIIDKAGETYMFEDPIFRRWLLRTGL